MNVRTYPVLSRVRRNGRLYAPGTDRARIDLTSDEAKRLKALGCIGEPLPEEPDQPPELSLAGALGLLKDGGTDVAELAMKDLKPLLPAHLSKATRADVGAALAQLGQGAPNKGEGQT